MTPRNRIDALPKHLLWRLAEAFQEYRRGYDADDQYVKLSEVEAALADLVTETQAHGLTREELHLIESALLNRANDKLYRSPQLAEDRTALLTLSHKCKQIAAALRRSVTRQEG